MKKFLLSCAALLALGGTALAADLPVKAPPPVAPPPFDWGGLYVGASADWFESRTRWHYTNPVPATLMPFSNTDNEFAWGIHGGAQWQWSWFVLGVDADYTIPSTQFRGPLSNGTATSVCTANVGQACQTRMSNITMAGGRAGFAWNDWLFFGEGGWASGTIESRVLNTPGTIADTANNSDYRNGWYAGGGVNYAIYKTALMDVIIGADYRHIDLRTHFQPSSLDTFGPAPPGINGRNIGGTADMVRFTVDLKTNGWNFWGPPVVAKY